MGRRRKEPESVHREAIAAAAERLFLQYGTEAAKMDDIAREAGYSKATLYVYFASKEDILLYLVSKSMTMLHRYITEAISGISPARDKYLCICRAMARCQQQYPLYFKLVLGKINVDFEGREVLPIEKEIFETGEQINAALSGFFRAGIRAGEFQPDLPILETVFLLWGSLSGLVQITASKEAYFEKTMNCSREAFLEFGFERLYRLIAAEEIK